MTGALCDTPMGPEYNTLIFCALGERVVKHPKSNVELSNLDIKTLPTRVPR